MIIEHYISESRQVTRPAYGVVPGISGWKPPNRLGALSVKSLRPLISDLVIFHCVVKSSCSSRRPCCGITEICERNLASGQNLDPKDHTSLDEIYTYQRYSRTIAFKPSRVGLNLPNIKTTIKVLTEHRGIQELTINLIPITVGGRDNIPRFTTECRCCSNLSGISATSELFRSSPDRVTPSPTEHSYKGSDSASRDLQWLDRREGTPGVARRNLLLARFRCKLQDFIQQLEQSMVRDHPPTDGSGLRFPEYSGLRRYASAGLCMQPPT